MELGPPENPYHALNKDNDLVNILGGTTPFLFHFFLWLAAWYAAGVRMERSTLAVPPFSAHPGIPVYGSGTDLKENSMQKKVNQWSVVYNCMLPDHKIREAAQRMNKLLLHRI